MAFKVLFEFSGLSMLHLFGEGADRKLNVLLSDTGKDGSPHTPRLIVPVENIGNVAELVEQKDALGLGIVIGPRGQYLCDIDLRGKEITVPGSGGVTSEPDPEVQGGSLPLPMSVDDWKPLAYLPNVRAMSTPGAKVNPTPAVARVSAATGHLYAAPSPNERERFRKWVVRSGAEERRQYLADRAVLEMAIPKALSNLRVVLAWAGNEVGLVLRPAEGDSTADVVVVISSHCCLSKSADVVENQGPPIEDLQGYEKFVSVKTDLSRGVVLLPEDVHFTVGNPRCPAAVWE